MRQTLAGGSWKKIPFRERHEISDNGCDGYRLLCTRRACREKNMFAGGENIQIVFLRKAGRNRPKRILHKKQTKQKQIICYQLQCSDTNTSTKFHCL